MEFLIIWVLSGDVIDSGLRYQSAEECYAAAQNSGSSLRSLGINPPQFTCIPMGKDKEFKIYRKNSSSGFPFN